MIFISDKKEECIAFIENTKEEYPNHVDMYLFKEVKIWNKKPKIKVLS
jgi:uncharacterized protein YeeX (DUF496 family)